MKPVVPKFSSLSVFLAALGLRGGCDEQRELHPSPLLLLGAALMLLPADPEVAS